MKKHSNILIGLLNLKHTEKKTKNDVNLIFAVV